MLIRNRLISISDSQPLYFAEAAKEDKDDYNDDDDDDDDMDGFLTDEEDEDDSGSDREMGAEAEDGDEAHSSNLRTLTDQVCGYNYEDLKYIFMHILIEYRILSSAICMQ